MDPNDTTEPGAGNPKERRPYISADTHFPEITVKGVLLGIILSILLAGANAYLGLLAGMTVSASIPAAVISMALLRLFRRSNILENNIVQTAASAGESLAAGVIFTFPALILLEVWEDFNYWETTAIAGLGGLIGVLFTIPLRRALIAESTLRFPEGTATAEVLKVGDQGGAGVRSLLGGAGIGALFKFGESGLGLWTQAVEGARHVGSSLVYLGSNVLPSLLAVGYIVGFNIAVLVFLGGALNWFVAIPIYAATHPWPSDLSPYQYAMSIWDDHTRYLGVGAMLVGGLWTLFRMGGSIVSGITSGLRAYRHAKDAAAVQPLRTERDTPMPWVMALLAIAVIPLFGLFYFVTQHIGVAGFMAVVMLVAGFLFSAVAAYMAGLVGSSNNPVSGVTLATLLISSLLLLLLLGEGSTAGPGAAILIGAVVCCAAAIGGDNMQDLKAGALLGATPKKQQIMQGIGVFAAALVMAPVLSLLLNAYGIGEPTPTHPDALAAPQATLMASVTKGVFEQDLPWLFVGIGIAIAIALIGLDSRLEAHGSSFRLPVLAVAVGLYLPFKLEVPILIGGLLAWWTARPRRQEEPRYPAADGDGQRRGLLFAAGLITGEALLGILLAIPIVLFAGQNPFDLSEVPGPLPKAWAEALPLSWPGLVLLLLVMGLLIRVTRQRT